MAIPNEPLTRAEQYLNRKATGGGTIPEFPLTRTEQYLNKIATSGGENGGTIGKRDKLIGVCQEYNIQCIDNYSTLGINELTASTFLADGLHPSAAGKVLMYNHIAQELW